MGRSPLYDQHRQRRAADSGNEVLDPNLSLGKCYFASGEEAGDNFIPCGNYAFDHYTCCQAGDNCMSSNACFNYRGGITYLAGCTDSTYNSTACPRKGEFDDQQWSGLVVCDADAGTWANCQERDGAVMVENANNCNCDGKQPAFTAGAALEPTAVLPLALSGTISWYEGHSPTGLSATMTPTSSSSSTSIPPSDPTSSSVPPTSITSSSASSQPMSTSSSTTDPGPTATPDQSSGLTYAATIGVGVGCGVGALLIVAIAFMVYLVRKRRRSGLHSVKSHPRDAGDRPHSAWHGTVDGSVASPVTAMTGFKSELPADEPKSARILRSGSSPGSPSARDQFEAYDPKVHGDYDEWCRMTEMSSPQVVSPDSGASATLAGSTEDGTARGGRSKTPVAELEG